MDWRERTAKKPTGSSDAEKARIEREARALARAQQKPATRIAAAWRGSHARGRERAACRSSVSRKVEDVEKESVSTPMLRDVSFALVGLKGLRGEGRRRLSRDDAALVERVMASVMHVAALVAEASMWRLARLVRLCWAAVATIGPDAPASKRAVLGLTADDGDCGRAVARRCADLWDVELSAVLRSKPALDAARPNAAARRGEAALAEIFDLGAARCDRPLEFATAVLSVPLVADVVGPEVLRRYCASGGFRAALDALLMAPPADLGADHDVDGQSWLLGNVTAVAVHLDLADKATARLYCLLVARLLHRARCAEAMLSDDDSAGALRHQTLALVSRERFAALIGSLSAAPDDDALDARTAEDARLDADLASVSSDSLYETAARKRRSMLTDVLGAKWARQLDSASSSIQKGWSLFFSTTASTSATKNGGAKTNPATAAVAAAAAVTPRLAATAVNNNNNHNNHNENKNGTPAKEALTVRKLTAAERRARLEDARALSLVIVAVLAVCGPKRANIFLTSIAFGKAELPRRLWGVVFDADVRGSLARYLAPSKSREADDPDAVAAVAVACAATLQHALVPVDDDELRATMRPLGVHQLRRIVQVTKEALYAWCGKGKSSSSSSSSSSSRCGGGGERSKTFAARALSTLLRDLHARSVRRPFARPTLWVVQAADSSSETHRLLASLRTAPATIPRLLRVAPFAVPFRERAQLFADAVGSVANARAESYPMGYNNNFEDHRPNPRTNIRVRRGREFEDALMQLADLAPDRLRGRLHINFDGEVGIDAGGLFKELWTELATTAFAESHGLFKSTDDGLLYPNPDSEWLLNSNTTTGSSDDERLYRFVGRVLGKALREGITIQPRFARFFLAFVRGDYNYLALLDDLATLDFELYKNLRFLREYPGDVADLGLTFSVDHERFGAHVTVDLVHRGRDTAVTSKTRHLYIQLVAKHHLVDRVARQSRAFVAGLGDAIDLPLLRLFSEPELQLLVSGAETAFDVDDLQAHARTEGFLPADKHVARFWRVMRDLDPKHRAAVLKFATSCERAPPLGFCQLQPPFTLRKVPISRDDEKLPTASTCFNTLKIPTYSSEAVLKKRLITSIESGAGFDLS